MWQKGPVQPKILDFSASKINEELKNREGYIPEEEAYELLFKFLRNNIGYGCELLLGVKLFPFQEMLIKSMMIGDFNMFVLSRGMSKTFSAGVYVLLQLIFRQGIEIGVISSSFRQCLHPDALIPTKSGLKKLGNLNVGDWVYSRNGLNKVVDKWTNPKTKSKKIKTNKNYSMEGKIGHRFLVYNPDLAKCEYKNIEEAEIGDIVPIKTGTKCFGNKTNIFEGFKYREVGNKWVTKPVKLEDNEDFYYFLGLIIAEGGITTGGGGARKIHLTNGDKEIVNWCDNYLKIIAPKHNSFFYKKSDSKNCWIFGFSSNKFCDALEYLGYKREWKAGSKKIPDVILQANKKKVSNLLRGMFDGDGGVTQEKGNPNVAQVKYTTISKALAKQIHLILLNYGIVSRLQETEAYQKTTKDGVKINASKSYDIRITGKKNLKIFHDEIGFRLLRKQNILEESLKLASPNKRFNEPVIPGLDKFMKNHGYRDVRGSSYNRLRDALEKKESLPELDQILKDDFYFDKIVSIEDGECETIDIEVENEHCYVGDGFINHNSKGILQKSENIIKKPKAALVKGLFKFKKGTDQWELSCGDSRAIALPLADGSKLRGFRFQILLLDEFLNIPKNVFQEVLLPFIGVIENPTERADLRELEDQLIAEGKMKEGDRFKWVDNKLILLSSPSYTFEYMYELYCSYRDSILGVGTKNLESGEEDPGADAYKIIFQLGYDTAPPDLYDKNQLSIAKQTMSEAVFKKEYGGQFVSESDSYFKLSKMAACTVPDGSSPHVEVAGNPAYEYIISCDPAWSESAESDSFAMQVFKLDMEEQRAYLVHAYAMPGTALKKHIEYFHYLITHFNVSAVVFDYNGGVQFLNACNESELFKKDNIKLGVIDVEHGFDHPEHYHQDLLQFKRERKPSQYNYCIQRKPTSGWIRQANELLQANIDHKRIWFAAPTCDSSFHAQQKANIPIDKLKWDVYKKPPSKNAQMIDFIDNQVFRIEQTKQQCANIEVVTNPQGSQTFRLPPHMSRQTGPNRPRKDAYSALCLGSWASKILFDSHHAKEEQVNQGTFTPFAF